MNFRNTPKLLQTNLHFVWVILFFILHGYAQSYQLVPLKELLILTCQITIASIIFFALSTRFFRSKIKGGIFTSAVLIIILFFGAFQDFFADKKLLSILSYLRPLILICLILIIIFFFYLKKTMLPFNKTVVYINTLFLVYLMIDIITIFFLSSSASSADGKTLHEFKSAQCDTCKPPSVYLVVMDEYMGTEGLKEYFHYSNASFENFLISREFRVFKNSRSNYQRTLFSMASILNMRYIPEIREDEMDERYPYNKVLSLLRNNVVCKIFQHNGYKTINLSPFEIRNAPSEIISTELPQRIELIAAQTMVYRIGKYMPGWLADLNIIPPSKKAEVTIVDANELAMKKALTVAGSQGMSPVFAYLHLTMPHSPFVFDSLGRKTGFWSQNLSPVETDKAYLQYLVYTNHRIEKFIQQLQQATMNKAVIALMSDHGYRAAAQRDIHHAYQTLNAIFLPAKNYGHWYDGMSNVNQFRVLLNSVFGQRLPLLKDSIVLSGRLE